MLYLDSQDAKDDEKGTADENYVSYRLQRGDQSLHNQLEARSSTDNPVKRKDVLSTLHSTHNLKTAPYGKNRHMPGDTIYIFTMLIHT